MRPAVTVSFLAAFLTCIFLIPTSAHADSIDGTWCLKDGRNLKIDGEKITTTRGALNKGNYGRHDFSYVAPAGEPGAGSRVEIVLLDDDHASYQNDADIGEPLRRRSLHTS